MPDSQDGRKRATNLPDPKFKPSIATVPGQDMQDLNKTGASRPLFFIPF